MGLKREKVIITRKAQESIKEIFEYVKIESSSLETARKVKDGIINRCKELKSFSGYSEEPYLSKLGDYKSVIIWNYVIIFSVRDKTVNVLNIIHTSMHPDKRKDI